MERCTFFLPTVSFRWFGIASCTLTCSKVILKPRPPTFTLKTSTSDRTPFRDCRRTLPSATAASSPHTFSESFTLGPKREVTKSLLSDIDPHKITHVPKEKSKHQSQENRKRG